MVKKINVEEVKIPLSPGIILAEMYLILIYGHQIWYNILPKTKINDLESDWGLTNVKCNCPGNPTPDLKYFLTKLRNSCAHAHTKLIIPPTVTKENKFNVINVVFQDTQAHFETKMNLNEIFQLRKRLQNYIHKHVRNKKS